MGEMAHRWGPLEELAVARGTGVVGQEEGKDKSKRQRGNTMAADCCIVHPTLLDLPLCTRRTVVELAAVLGS
jgi:hypothetical protein